PGSRDARRRPSHELSERTGDARGADLLEATCADGARPRLPTGARHAHPAVVRVGLFDRAARLVAAVAHDRPAVRPRTKVDGRVPMERDGGRSLLGRDVRQPGVDADDSATRAEDVDDVARSRRADGIYTDAGQLPDARVPR